MTKTNTDAVTNGVTNTAAAKPSRRRKSAPKVANAAAVYTTGVNAEPKAKDVASKRKPSNRERYPYDPKYCGRVEKLGEDGLSLVEIRRELGIPRSAWKRWISQFPEFAEAVDEADDAARAFMERLGRLGVTLGTKFSAPAYVFLMKNRWPAIYRDRQDHQITGANDGPIVQELRAPDLASIADPKEALRQFEAFRASLAIAVPAQTRH